jgi:glycosyltransferase involved in cell wall biosynthesis
MPERLRVCLLSYRGNMYSGGQGIYLYYLSRELARRGHEITIMVGPPYPAPMPWARVIKISNQNFYGVRRDFLPRSNPLSMFTPLNFSEFAMTRFWFFPEILAFSLRAFRKLTELWNEGVRFDLIHDNQCLGYGYLLMRAFGVPVIASIHHPLGLDRSADFEQTQALIERLRRVVFYPFIMQKLVARSLDMVISGSQDSAQAVCRAFQLNPAKMRVVYDGVDDDVFHLYPAIEKIPHRLIFVGNTEDRKKGILYLIQALEQLPQDTHLLIVDGCSNYKFWVNWLLDKYKLHHRVQILERLSSKALAREYARSEISVVPSVYEGFGLPAAEAMACGLPVVSTTGGALPEVVGDDGASILVPPKNASAIARAIRKLLDQPALREEMGQQGFKRVMERFTWRECACMTSEVYREAVSRGSTHADR